SPDYRRSSLAGPGRAGPVGRSLSNAGPSGSPRTQSWPAPASWAASGQPGFGALLQDSGLDEVLEIDLGYRTVRGSFWDHRMGHTGDGSHRLAIIGGRIKQAIGHDLVEIPFGVLFLDRDLGRQRTVDIHHHQLGVERIVVVGVIPVDCARRHIAVAVCPTEILAGLDRRRPDPVDELELAIRRDKALAAITVHERVEQVGRVAPVGRHLETEPIYPALAILAQIVLHFFVKVEIGFPGPRTLRQVHTGLLDQRFPGMTRDAGTADRHAVE